MNLDENLFYKKILMRLRKELPAGNGAAGAPGATGPAGATGAAGRDGKDGAVGGTGPAGKDGVAGPQGAPGSTGATGAAGRDGVDGAPGATGAAGAKGVDAKRIDTYTGTTDANGLLTIVYASAFAAIPSIQPEPPTASNQTWAKVTSTTTGCSLRLVQRSAVTVLGLEVLLAGTTNVAGAPARVVVVAA